MQATSKAKAEFYLKNKKVTHPSFALYDTSRVQP